MMRNDSGIECRLWLYRRERGWTQQDLAERLGVGRQFVHEMESNRRLPNTALALRLARIFGCAVEEIFVDRGPDRLDRVHLLPSAAAVPGLPSRLGLARVRERLVGIPLSGAGALQTVIPEADALPGPDGLRLLVPQAELDHRAILMGCDPAFDLLRAHAARRAPKLRAHVVFGSSRASLAALGSGAVHLAGIHFSIPGAEEANVKAVREALPHTPSLVLGFSLLEEGLMVAPGNPLALTGAGCLARPGVRHVNRESGAALRSLLHKAFVQAGLATTPAPDRIVYSHVEGAAHVACGATDAAPGLRLVAEAFGLAFVPLAVTRCDLVVPADLREHPGVAALLDTLQSADLRREIDSLPGYDAALTGSVIAAP